MFKSFEKEIMNNVGLLIQSGRTVSTMESCTGGLLASTITDCCGASDILPGTFVTYSNEAKIAQGVPADIIEKYGVYSPETAKAMARACACRYGTQIGIGVTGSLGRKDPNNSDSTVGQVFYCIWTESDTKSVELSIPSDLTDRHSMKVYIVRDILVKLTAFLP